MVVDASVAIKWLVSEVGTAEARTLLEGDNDLLAPDHLLVECASTLTKRVRRGLLDPQRSALLLDDLLTSAVRIAPSQPLIWTAHSLAIELQASLYDCLYLALARKEGAVVVTADDRFRNAAEARGYGALVKSLVAP